MANSLTADQFSAEFMKLMESQEPEIRKIASEEAKKSAQKLVDDTKSSAPREAGSKRSGTYAKHIAMKELEGDSLQVGSMWYVKAPDYRLTHLLINGHLTRNGRMTKAKDFLTEPTKKNEEEFVNNVKERIEKNG
jgi:hypothetical protein